jgi:hypothetical protein
MCAAECQDGGVAGEASYVERAVGDYVDWLRGHDR